MPVRAHPSPRLVLLTEELFFSNSSEAYTVGVGMC